MEEGHVSSDHCVEIDMKHFIPIVSIALTSHDISGKIQSNLTLVLPAAETANLSGMSFEDLVLQVRRCSNND